MTAEFPKVTCDELMKDRRSIRAYKNKPVSKDVIEKVIDLATEAPSVLNAQPWHFTVVQGEKREAIMSLLRRSSLYLEDMMPLLEESQFDAFKAELDEKKKHVIKFYDTLGGAPVIIVISMRKVAGDVRRRMALQGCAMAVQNLMLAAHSLGLGTCCVGSALWVEEELLQIMDLNNSELITIVSLGYPDETPKAPPRKKDVTTWVGP